MGPKETWLLKAPLDVNKVANVALLSLRRQTTKKRTRNRQNSFLLICVIEVHATLVMLLCKRMEHAWWKKCFARAVKVLRTTGKIKYLSKTFQPNKIKHFQQKKGHFCPFLPKMQRKNTSLSVKQNSFFLDISVRQA